MKPFYFDIETVPCQQPGIMDEFRAAVTAPAQYKKADSIAAWLDENREAEAEAAWLKTSFDGGMGQVVAISYAMDGDVRSLYAPSLSRDDEAHLLHCFFSDFEASGPKIIVGHNVIGFDIPFLWKRAMVLNIKPPMTFPRNPKPWSELVADTMLLWDSNQRAGGSMDRICKLMGLGGKGDISGSDVWPMVKAGRIAEVSAYCADDVRRTRAMFKRMTFAD